MNSSMICDALKSDGLVICPDFLPNKIWKSIRTDLDACLQDGQFKRAGTGQGSGKGVRDLVRRDQIYWLDQSNATDAQNLIWQELEKLKQEFNRTLFLGINSFEGHYAAYPEGGFYKRHLDCFQKNDDRVVSLILYLNKDWKPVDGGELRVYENTNHLDIQPKGGTLVCFMSREKEHEVLTSHAPRFSFSGWFKIK